jgi:hypothetical protein
MPPLPGLLLESDSQAVEGEGETGVLPHRGKRGTLPQFLVEGREFRGHTTQFRSTGRVRLSMTDRAYSQTEPLASHNTFQIQNRRLADPRCPTGAAEANLGALGGPRSTLRNAAPAA